MGGPETLAGFARRATADAKSASKRKGAARAAREGSSEEGVGVIALNPAFSVDSTDGTVQRGLSYEIGKVRVALRLI